MPSLDWSRASMASMKARERPSSPPPCAPPRSPGVYVLDVRVAKSKTVWGVSSGQSWR
jgi:hypothetical protein